MTEKQIRAIVLQVIAERTMPKIWSGPDDEWLIPFREWVKSGQAIGEWIERFAEMERDLRRLKAKVEEHLP